MNSANRMPARCSKIAGSQFLAAPSELLTVAIWQRRKGIFDLPEFLGACGFLITPGALEEGIAQALTPKKRKLYRRLC
jgi:hypothetical protein